MDSVNAIGSYDCPLVDSISSLHASQILEDHLQRAQQHQSYVSSLFQQVHSQYEGDYIQLYDSFRV
jgi:hypothetical protein